MADYLVQEDGTSKILLEDGTGAILLETSSGGGGTPPSLPDARFGAAIFGSPYFGAAEGGSETIIAAPFIASATVVYAPSPQGERAAPFIASKTVVYTPELRPGEVFAPFIASVTVVYAPTLEPGEVLAPFIASGTRVFDPFSLFDPNRTFSGPGNGGETFALRLAPGGGGVTATLAGAIGTSSITLALSGAAGMPTSQPFVVTIDDEILYLIPTGGSLYTIRGRGLGNTIPAAHAAGADVVWGDSYDQAIVATQAIEGSFTADINGAGPHTYPGWLIPFDSTQGYLAGDRYPMHVAELLGVFDAGAGSSGANRCDAAQPNAICTPTGVSDDCPAALGNPSRIQANIAAGDVAVCRYTNPEGVELDLGPRSVAVQSWFGLKRVDALDNDVTFTDPNGIVIDTTMGELTYTGSINGEWLEPSEIGIAPDTGEPTPNPCPYTTATLPGTQRYFTYGSAGGGFDEQGWPIGVLCVRQGNRRVPHWRSYDWHNYSYVYAGFGTDDTFAQVVINRNGIVFDSLPEVDLPGPQDITGPDAVWDDDSYYFGASWYVAIFAGPYLVVGPSIGGTPIGGDGAGGSFVPGVTFPPGGGPIVTVPPSVEGGEGGDISPAFGEGLHVWARV